MSTYSTSLRAELITNGAQAGTWGDTTNGNFNYVFDTAIAGYQTVSVTAASQAFTYVNGPTATASANQSIYAMLRLTTSTGAAFSVYAPPNSKAYIIYNNSGYTATIYNSTVIGNTTAAGAGISISNGNRVMVFSDGTNFYDLQAQNLTGTLAIANGGTGQVTANTAFNALVPSQASANGKYLKSDGTNTSWDQLDISTGDVTGTLPIVNGGTGVTTSTGSGNNVLSTSPTLVTPILGTPQSGNFSTGTFTWPTFNQNTTGTAAGLSATLAVTSGGTGVTTSTGSGSNVLSTSPTFVTPILGTPTSGNLANCTFPTLNQNTTGTAAGLSSTLAVTSGGTGVTTFASGALLKGAGTSAIAVASAADIVGQIGTTAVTNATNATNATNVSGTVAVANGGTGSTTASAAASALGVPGYNQTWQLPSRDNVTTYTNSTSAPITVYLAGVTFGNVVYINGASIGGSPNNGNYYPYSATFIVPVGATYSVSAPIANGLSWAELR